MLKSLMKKLKNLTDLSDIKKILQNDQTEISESIDSYISETLDYKRFVKSEIDLGEYIDGFCLKIRKIEESKDRAAQAIFLRELTLDALDQIAITGWYINDENELGDVSIISRKHTEFDGLQIDKVIEKASDICHRNVVQFCCLRHLSKQIFEDATEFDYAKLYLDTSSLIERHENSIDLSEAKDTGGDLFEMFLPTLHQSKQDMRKNVLEGQNYDSTPSDEDDLDETEEEEIVKVPEVTEEHYQKLKEILFDRIDLINHEQLYVAKGYAPNDPINVIRFDTGMMLIALVKCVEDREACFQTIKDLFREWLLSLKLSEESKKEVGSADIPLDDQMTYLEIMEKSSEGGWLAEAMMVGALMMYGIKAEEYEKFDSQEQTAFGELGFELMRDAWKIYAQTQNVFGHDVNEGWLGDDDDEQAETT